MQTIILPPSWQTAIGAEFAKPYMLTLSDFLQAETAAGKQTLPAAEQRFNALQSTPLEQVNVVILGQDPYPTLGHAHGLAFSVQPHVTPLPRSLLNINRELRDDLGIDNSHTGCLQAWAEQGVLLLNTVLTVEASNAGSHQKRGWETFTDTIIQAVSAQASPVVFMLWGNHAQKKMALIDSNRHCILISAHPSPLSARRGFFGSRPFSRANDFLQTAGRTPINWSLPAVNNRLCCVFTASDDDISMQTTPINTDDTSATIAATPTFTDFALAAPLLQAVQKMGFTQPRSVQLAAIPPAMTRRDLLVSAETGSGKTAAFLLPTLHHLLANPSEYFGTRALVLVPTRELAKQIHQQCLQLAEFTALKVGLITGGADFRVQQNMLLNNAEIVIATPGRVLELMAAKTPEFSRLEVLILDEADRMLEMGFSQELETIAAVCNPERQTLLFSATLQQYGMSKIAEKLLRDPEMLRMNTLQDEHENLEQQVIIADDVAHKQRLLAWLLLNETFAKAVVFTNSRARADDLVGGLQVRGVRCGVLHGDMDQKERNRIMAFFRDGTIKALIATDLAARGLDIAGVELVINVDVPRTGVHYIHRIGRTGRGDAKGTAITLVQSSEWNLMVNIERFLKQRFQRRSIAGLVGTYTGPQKLKASGKAAGSKKKKLAKKAAAAKKGKKR